MSVLRSICFAGAFVIISCAASSARADDPSPEAMGRSSALYKQARALHVRGKWAEAESAYQAAWDLRRTFDIAGNLGDCEMHVGQAREAAEHLSYALGNVPAGVTSEQIEALRSALREAQKQVGTLEVVLNVSGAQLFVDGKRAEVFSGKLFVEPGLRTIEAQAAGYEAAKKTVTVRPGTTEKAELALAPPKRSAVPAIVIGGVGLVAAASGIGLLIAAGAKTDPVRDLNASIVKAGHTCLTGAASYDPRCEKLHDMASSGDAMHNAGVGLLVGASAAAVGTVVYMAWPRSVRVAPSASATGAGLIVSGAF